MKLKHIYVFLYINFYLLTLGLIQYKFFATYNISFIFICFFLRNVNLLYNIEKSLRNKPQINEPTDEYTLIYNNKINKEIFYNIVKSSLLDSIFITHILTTHNFKSAVWYLEYNPIYFILLSFFYEIILDFWHYVIHRGIHNIPFLYVNFHKYHHKLRFVNVYTTFCMNPIDQFLSIIIPTYITLYIFPFDISKLYFSAFLIYQKYIEISGHCGKKISGNSFTPFMYLPKIFNIHAKVEDHDIHHTLNNCNYSKRFTLWDKVFNTYKQIKLD